MTSLRRHRNDRGVVAIEFVFIFPFLYMLFVGIIALGLFYGSKAQANELAREGARAAALHQPLPAGTATCVPSSTSCTPDPTATCPSPNDPTKFVTVKAIKNVSLRSIPIIGINVLPSTIDETVTMRCGG